MRILIIDDEMINLSLLQVFFSDREEKVITCSSGQEAINVLENNTEEFDIVFLDLMMPVIDGFDVLKKIRELPHREHLPVIIQSGKADKRSIEKAIDSGADTYLVKPFSLEDLPNLFRRCIEDKKHLLAQKS